MYTVPSQTRTSGTSNKSIRWQVQSKQLGADLHRVQGCTGEPCATGCCGCSVFTALQTCKERKKKKNSPQETLHTQMPPLAEEGGEVGGFSGVGCCVPAPSRCCVPAPSRPPLWQSPLLKGFKVGWWLQPGTCNHPAMPALFCVHA